LEGVVTCVFCGRRHVGDKSRADRADLRGRGWFIWADGGPRQFDGTVVCPQCREVMKTVQGAIAYANAREA
jgi:uncharacterized Zn finger protein (UPF0148 family)